MPLVPWEKQPAPQQIWRRVQRAAEAGSREAFEEAARWIAAL